MPVTAGQMMDNSASLLNDPNKVTYTYTKMLPYFKMAYQKVSNRLGLLGHQAVSVISGTGTVIAGSDKITSIDGSLSTEILLEPVYVFERTPGADDNSWYIMDPVMWEALREPRETLDQWSYRQGYIKFVPATVDREVKVFYRGVLTPIVDASSTVDFPIFRDFLESATAAFIAEFVMKDKGRAVALYDLARDAMEIAVSHSTKIMQKHPAKRRPYFFGR